MTAAFQSTVNILTNLGVIGDIVLDEPHREQPLTLDGNGGSLGNYFIKNATTGIATQGGVASAGSSSFTATLVSTSQTITVTALGAGSQPISVGQTITGTGIPASTTITGYGTGAGGLGTYTISNAATASGSESITGASGPPTTIGGIAVNPKIEPLFGSSAANPLNPNENLQPNEQGLFMTMGSVVVDIPNSFNVGDLVTYDVNTGVLGSVAPGASLPSTYAYVPNAVIYGAPSQGGVVGNSSGGGLALIRLTN